MTKNEYKNWSMQFLAKTPETNKIFFRIYFRWN